ncbi:MAG: DUF4405 domain-containing protein [Methylobacteriaceae bacterium]|jgi:hypothetical protein|nr:DUF4405 domain-containing protein [Methylobacteriaceae bacterium]
MKPKAIVKTAVDSLMTAAVLAMMGRHLWGNAFHEWLGVFTGVLFLVHNILNYRWYAALFKGRYTLQRTAGLWVTMLLLAAMAALLASGIVMAGSTFGLPKITGMTALARQLHILGSHWGFLLISLHLGMNWKMLVGMATKPLALSRPSPSKRAVMFTAALMIAAYGAYVFVKRDFITGLLLKSEFVFLDFSEPKLLFLVDYIALMGLGVFSGHHMSKGLKAVSDMLRRRAASFALQRA